MLTPCPEQSCFVPMYPLTVCCSFKLMVQRQTHSMRLRSSVIKTPLLGGDRDFMAEVITEASVERAIPSGCVRVKEECVCVCVEGLVSPFCILVGLFLHRFVFNLKIFSL